MSNRDKAPQPGGCTPRGPLGPHIPPLFLLCLLRKILSSAGSAVLCKIFHSFSRIFCFVFESFQQMTAAVYHNVREFLTKTPSIQLQVRFFRPLLFRIVVPPFITPTLIFHTQSAVPENEQP